MANNKDFRVKNNIFVTGLGTSTFSGDVSIGDTITVQGAATFQDEVNLNSALNASSLSLSGNATISGNLTVSGTTTWLNSTNTQITDRNIVLNYSTGDSSGSANGAGITIQDAVNSTTDASLLWNTSLSAFKFSNTLHFDDGIQANFGTSSDLQILHDGSHSYIKDVGTGSLRIRGTDLLLESQGGETFLYAANNGAVTLYHNNAPKLATASTGVNVTGAIQLNGTNFAFESGSGTYHQITDPTGNTALYLGGSDEGNYHNNTTHYFRNRSGTNYAFLNSNGFYLSQGGYRVGTTQVITSSRNLVNIGTISSGAITSIGNSRFNGDFQVGDTLQQNAYGALQVNQTSNVDEEGIAVLSSGGGRSIRIWVDETNSYINSGNGGSGNLIFNEAITVSSGGNLTGVGTINSGAITSSGNINTTAGEFKINGVTVINTSRQLRNIEAIRIQSTEIMDNTRLLKNITGIELTGTNRQIKFLGDAGPFGLEFGDTEANPNFRIYYRTTPNTLTFENNASSAKHTFDLSGNYTSTGDITSGDDVIVGDLLIMAGGNTKAIAFTGTGSDTNVRHFAYEESGHHIVTNRHTDGDLILKSNNGTGGGELARMTLQAGSGTQDIDITNANLDLNSNNITGVGTISSGAITSSSNLTLGANGIIDTASGHIIFKSAGGTQGQFISTGFSLIGSYSATGNYNTSLGSYQIGGTTVIDNSRNLTNISTITSGAITSSGTITSTGNGVTNVMSFSDRGIFGTTSNHPVEIRANGTQAIRIDTAQLIGIGTSSPGFKLDLVNAGTQLGSSGFYANARFKDTDNVGVFLGHNNTSNGVGMVAGINDLAFLTYSGSWGERMRISGTNVGIGTSSPSQKLHVAGNIYAASGFVNSSGYQLNGTYIVDSSRNLVNIGTITAGGVLKVSMAQSSGSPILDLHNSTNAANVEIRFTDIAAGNAQFGHIRYNHADSKSYGSGASFVLGSDQSSTTILADGKLMFSEGLYVKPTSGTGAGTQIISNSGVLLNSALSGTYTSALTLSTVTINTPIVGTSNQIRFANNDYIRYDDSANRFHFDADGGTSNASVQAATFVGALTGNVTGTATGLSGTPNITVGTISSGAITSSNILTVDYTAPIIRLKPDNGAFFQLRANESPARLEVGHSNNKNLYLSNTGNATFNYDLNVVSNFKINGTTVIDSSRNLTNIGSGSFSGTVSINQGASFSKLQIGTGRTGATENIGAVEFLNSSSALKAQVYGSNDGKLRLTTNGNTTALTLDSSQVATFENTIDVKSQSTLLQRWFEGSTEVGRAIGVSGVQMAIGSGDTGVLFNASINAVYPWQPTTNAGLDNIVDLGISSRKWRDIYFGGNLKVGSTTVIDSSRNLTNIGTISSGVISIGTDTGVAFNSAAYLKIQPTGGNAFINIKTGTSNNAGILLGDTDDNYVGGLIYNNSTNALTFNSGNATALTLDNSQNATFAGNITATTGDIQAGSSGNSAFLRAYYGTAYMTLQGYGLEMNRTTSYIRPTTDGNKTLYVGGVDASLDWAAIHFRSLNGLYMTGTRFLTTTRDLENIGTISSGEITSSGSGDQDLTINSTNAKPRVLLQENGTTKVFLESLASGVSGQFGIYSAAASKYALLINTSGNTSLNGGTLTSGAITSSGNIVTTSSSAVIQTPRISMEADGTLDWGSAKQYGTLTWDTNKAIIKGQASSSLEFQTNNNGVAMTIDTSQRVGIGTGTPYSGARVQICGDDTTPSLNTTAIDDCSLIVSNSDDDYGTVFATDGTGKGYIQQRRMATATYYDLNLQPYGGNVCIGNTSAAAKLDIRQDSGYAIRCENGSGHYFRVNSTGAVEVAGSEVITASRNLINIGTISSGNITVTTSGITSNLYGNDLIFNRAGPSYIRQSGGGSLLFTTSTSNTIALTLDASQNATFAGDVLLADSKILKLGTGLDLQIYHNGTDSFINNDTGTLFIKQFANDGDIKILSDDGSGNTTEYIRCDGGLGQVKLFHYGSEKFITTSAGIKVTGEVNVTGELEINGTDVIDSSRNLVNIGTISSTNITSNGAAVVVQSKPLTVVGQPINISAPNSAEMKFLQTTGSSTASKGSIQWVDSGGNSCGTINLKADGADDNSGVMEFYVTANTDELGDDPFGINKMMTITENGVTVHGSLSKSSGSFRIDHPLKPDTHHLVHSFVEGPQADNLYRGKIELVDGRAVIDLDEWFGMTPGTFLALNRDLQAFVSNEEDWDAVRAKVMGSQLIIECQNARSKASVSWMVVGERQDNEIYESTLTDDYGKIIVEPEKKVVE